MWEFWYFIKCQKIDYVGQNSCLQPSLYYLLFCKSCIIEYTLLPLPIKYHKRLKHITIRNVFISYFIPTPLYNFHLIYFPCLLQSDNFFLQWISPCSRGSRGRIQWNNKQHKQGSASVQDFRWLVVDYFWGCSRARC